MEAVELASLLDRRHKVADVVVVADVLADVVAVVDESVMAKPSWRGCP